MDEQTINNGGLPDNSADNTPEKASAAKKKMPKWLRRTLKTIAWTVGSIAGVIILTLCLAVWLLTPARLTPIVEQIGNGNLNAELKIGKAELTVWKTFPYMSVELQDVDIRSDALKGYCGDLPGGADSLLSVGRIYASFNLAKIPLMEFDIRDILIDSPRVNIVAVNDSLSNTDIFPPSEGKQKPSSGIAIRSLSLGKFRITGNRGISYTNLKDSIHANIDTKTVSIDYGSDRFYSFVFDGDILAQLPADGIDQSIPFSVKGAAKWDIRTPGHCAVRDLEMDIADISAKLNADIAFDSVPTLNALDVAVGPLQFSKIIRHIPDGYKKGIDAFDTDFSASAKLRLAAPYKVNGNSYPTFRAELSIPNCYIENRKQRVRINDMEMNAKLDFDGTAPDKSTLSISRILLDGFGIRLDMAGKATNLLKDPKVEAKIAGKVDFARILGLIPQKMPFLLSGQLGLNTDVKFAVSDLSVSTFHRIKVNGDVRLSNVRYTVPADSLLFFADNSLIKFGTDSKFTNRNNETKNLLMASVQVDSLVIAEPGLRISANGLKAGVGSAGEMSSLLDTAQITPIGARIKLDRLAMRSLGDSSRIRVRDMEANGSIRGFGNAGKVPLMEFGIKAGRISYSDPVTSMNLKNGDIELAANLKSRKQSRRSKASIDSLCLAHPELPRDSVIALYRKERRRARQAAAETGDEYLDLSVDNEFKKLFRQWDLRGTIKAKSGRLFTPFFPLRNRLDDLDLSFNTKKFELHNLTYRAGKSDLSLNGEINNISDALLGSRQNPLTIDISATSKMFDLNELMAAAYKGSNFANSADKNTFSLNGSENGEDNDAQIDALIEQTAESGDTVKYAILIPKNIVLNVKIRNKKTRYADFDLSDLRSSIHVKNGVLNVKNLSGKSPDGNVRLDLIYATANRNDIGMGMNLELQDINVGRFMSLAPELDTIMPMMKGIDGVIDARLTATMNVDSLMNVILPSANAALHVSGKNLVLLDSETFRQLAKLLRFKDKNRNMIDSLSVEATAFNSQLDIYPFIISMDRYKLGIVGWNDFDTNYKYHVSVFDSPLFFKFGINLSGNFLQDKMKFRLGKAKLKESEVARSTIVTDTTKINLFKQMDEIFLRGADAGLRNQRARGNTHKRRQQFDFDEQLSSTDSLKLIESGVIERPDTAAVRTPENAAAKTTDKKRKPRKQQKETSLVRKEDAVMPKD